MITLGKEMLCVYGRLKPNQPSGEMWLGEMGTPEGFLNLHKKMNIRVRLFPRESQPCSSTRWWAISVKTRGFFRKNKFCKITERVGTKTFATTSAKYSVVGDNVEIVGQLEDDSVGGRYFLLRLKYSDNVEGNSPAGVMYEGTLARSRDFTPDGESWEITHDAMIFKDESPW